MIDSHLCYILWFLTFHPNNLKHLTLQQGHELVTLVGNVTFNFNGATVLIPSAVWLLGSGLTGIVGIRRKLKN